VGAILKILADHPVSLSICSDGYEVLENQIFFEIGANFRLRRRCKGQGGHLLTHLYVQESQKQIFIIIS
jgi:hypothetical protein